MPAAEHPPDDFLPIGRLGKTYQLRGGLRFRPLGDAEERALPDLDEVFVEGLGLTTLSEVRRHGRRLIVYLGGVHRIEHAKELVNARVFAAAAQLPEVLLLPTAGAPVRLNGVVIGEVLEVRRGPQDLVVADVAGREVLLPLGAPYLDWRESTLELTDPPEGLLP